MTKQDMHLHSDFSDGKNTIEEMTVAAISCGLQHICFCDHVRKTSDWIDSYQQEITRVRNKYKNKIEIFCAVETKALDFNGTLDIPDNLPADIIRVAAIHRIPDGKNGFISRQQIKDNIDASKSSYFKTVEGLKNNKDIERLAHPFSLFTEFGSDVFTLNFWNRLAELFACTTYKLEYNLKYDNSFVPKSFLKRFSNRILIASDSHSTEELTERINAYYIDH